MPLFKRSAFALADVPKDLGEDEEVFQVRFTKEVFRDYDEYVKRIDLYNQKVWACKVTGKANLSYEQALQSESKASAKVQKFPKEFVKPVLSMVQFSSLCVSELVDKLNKRFRDHFVEGELVDCDTETGRFKIVKVVEQYNEVQCENGGCKCSYEVFPEEADEGAQGSCRMGNTLKRSSKLSLSKGLLKSFIRESATIGVSKNSKWLVHEKLAQQHEIPTVEVGADGEQVVVPAVATRTRKRKAEDVVESQPVEDTLLPVNTNPRPEASGCDFQVPANCVGELLMVWDFCNSFDKVLDLLPFSLDEFATALCYTEGESVLLVDIHYALLKVVLTDASLYDMFNNKRKIRKRELSKDCWKKDLADVLDLKADAKVRCYTPTIRMNDYEDIEEAIKLEILSYLMECCLTLGPIRSQFEKHDPRACNRRKRAAAAAAGTSGDLADAELLDEDLEQLPSPPPSKRSRSSRKAAKKSKKKKQDSEDEEDDEEEQQQQKQEDKCPLRSTLLGRDRACNRYWLFAKDGRVFVEAEDSSKWSYYTDMAEFQAFVQSLDCNGVRETALKEQIQLHADAIASAFEEQ